MTSSVTFNKSVKLAAIAESHLEDTTAGFALEVK